VYAEGHPRLTLQGRFLAAVVACGDRAVLSHRSAAALWGVLPEGGPRIDVTVPSTSGRSRRGAMIVHRSPLGAHEVTRKDGIPVTTPARTVLDLAAVVSRRELERAIDEAAYLRLDLSGLEPRRGRRGGAAIARVLDEHRAGATRTRSELEERVLALCRRAGLPAPEVNASVEGFTVDFAWRAQQLIVETDGWQAHGTRAAFERDRRRDARLTAAGWRVLRLTWRRLRDEPGEVGRELGLLLA
jgi:very-short-patch-repair endonuclease